MAYLNIDYVDGAKGSVSFDGTTHGVNCVDGYLAFFDRETLFTDMTRGFPIHNIRGWTITDDARDPDACFLFGDPCFAKSGE